MKLFIAALAFLPVASYVAINHAEVFINIFPPSAVNPAILLLILSAFFWGWIAPIIQAGQEGDTRTTIIKYSFLNSCIALALVAFPLYFMRTLYPYDLGFVISSSLYFLFFVFVFQLMRALLREEYFFDITFMSIILPLFSWFIQEVYFSQTGQLSPGPTTAQLVTPFSFFVEPNISAIVLLVVMGGISLAANTKKITTEQTQ
jgi:hypothetical protein